MSLLPIFLQQRKVSTDSRNIPAGAIFFALRGDAFNGNQYAAQALEKGAAYVVVDDDAYYLPTDSRYIKVVDALIALQELAREYRQTWTIPVIGVTGSNGKTTTKELIASVLRTEKNTFATTGNLNNHIGVPLSILAVSPEVEIAIIEMGTNQPGDIQFLVEMALPDFGIITNVGKAHLEKLLSLDGVKVEKGQMFRSVGKKGGEIFVNETDARVVQEAKAHCTHHITYGTETSDFSCEITHNTLTSMTLCVKSKHWDGVEIFDAQLTGAYNALNILVAIAVGWRMGISLPNIKQGIYNYLPTNQRSQIIEKPHYHIWLDAYNANPSSMREAISNIFAANPNSRIALFLGDMFELGKESQVEHREIGVHVDRFLPCLTLLVGKEMKYAAEVLGGRAKHFLSVADIPDTLPQWIEESGADVVLIKGSRGMKMETILPKM